MTVSLPYGPQEYPQFRVLHARVWDGDSTAWVQLRMQTDHHGNGFYVESWNTEVLPEEGQAVLYFYYGRIDGTAYAIDGLPDLRGHEIRIQQKVGTDDAGEPIWETCWWGECTARLDQPWPGSDLPQGLAEYHCKDALHRTRSWPIDRHQAASADGSVTWGTRAGIPGALGHPGYNIRRGAKTIGNRFDSSVDVDLGFTAHTWPGSLNSTLWTDKQALEHAIAVATPGARFGGEVNYHAPFFTLGGATSLLDSKSWWEIEDGEVLRTFLTRISDRRRGRGNIHVAWTEPDGPDGRLVPFLMVQPQTLDGLTDVPLPSGATFTVPGATDEDQTVDVDLIGDQRLGPAANIEISEIGDTQYDALIMYGAPIRVVVPLSTMDDSAAKRWLSAEATAFDSASSEEQEANVSRWFHVHRTLGIPLTWNYKVGKGVDGDDLLRCDYRFDSYTGTGGFTELILDTPDVDDEQDTSPLLLSIADDLPIYAGYDYSTDPATRYSGSADGREVHLPIQVYKRVDDDLDYFIPLDLDTAFDLTRGGSEDRTDLTFQCDDRGGRLFQLIDPDEVVITAAIDLPHRLWMGSKSESQLMTIKKVKRLYTKEFAVHLAHPYAIMSLDESDSSNGGYAPIRARPAISIGAGPVYLRDDRDLFAQRFHLACLWYLRQRQTATWSLAGCGGAGGWEDADGETHPWPALGQVVDQFSYNGQTVTLGTPITSIRYARGRTTWVTSWHERDWR